MLGKPLLLFGLISGIVSAQDAEQRIRQLEARVQQLEARLAQVEELDQKLRVLDRKRELDQEAAAARAQETPVVQTGGDGFWLRSAEGDFRLNVGGYVQADGRFFPGNPGNQGTNTFLLRRLRPSLQGTLYKYIDFRIVPDFGGGTAAILDAYVELRYSPKASLRAGKFKTPVGLEQLQGDADVVSIERALPTNLVPNRDLGIQLSGDLTRNRLNYALGIFNGVPDGASGDADSNSRKDYVARLFATPFQTLRLDHPLRGLGFGLAASTGRQDGVVLPSFKTPGQVTFFSYATGVTAAGTRTRVSPQAYYYFGSLGVMAEFVRSQQKVRRGTAVTAVSNTAGQLAVSYLLTGERRSFRSPTPLRIFDPSKGGWGAWELVGRLEQLSVDPAVYSLALADPARSARRARAWAAGVNWYLNRNVKLALEFQDTGFTGGNRSHEKALLSRVQLGF